MSILVLIAILAVWLGTAALIFRLRDA